MSSSAVEKALRKLQHFARQPPPQDTPHAAATRRIPADLRGDEGPDLGLSREEVQAIDAAQTVLQGDLRFEHLAIEDAVWRFFVLCWRYRTVNHVPAFVEEHGKEVSLLVCFIPVEHLSVAAETVLPGVRLLPLGDPRIPVAGPWFDLQKAVGSCAAVEVSPDPPPGDAT